MFVRWILNNFPFSFISLFGDSLSVFGFVFSFQNAEEIGGFNVYFGTIFEDGAHGFSNLVGAVDAQNTSIEEAIVFLFVENILEITGQ